MLGLASEHKLSAPLVADLVLSIAGTSGAIVWGLLENEESKHVRGVPLQDVLSQRNTSFTKEILSFTQEILGFTKEILGLSKQILGFTKQILGFT